MTERPETVFLDALDDVFLAFDDAGTVVRHNQQAEAVTGYGAAELATMTVAEFFEDRAADRVRDAVEAGRETGDATFVARLVTADGERVPHEFSVRRLPADAPAAFVAVGRDVADRTVDEDPETLLERMSDGFLAVDTDWVVTDCNELGRSILGEATGLDPDTTTFEGRHIWDSIPDAEATTAYERYQEAMATGEPVSFRTYSEAVGGWFDVRVFPSERGLSVYFDDISTRREQREQLRTRERVLREMYEIIADRERSFPEQVQALLALGRRELGTAYGTLSRIEGEEYVFEYVDADTDDIEAGDVVPLAATNCELAASNEETLVIGDVERDAPSETDRAGYTEWGISCYIGAPVYVDDEVYGTFCFYGEETRPDQFSDWEVTLVDLMSRWASAELERQQVTEQLQEQNERLERVASVLSHDLRNPLTVATHRLDAVREECDSEHLDSIERSLNRMATLVDDVLSLARQGEDIGDTERVQLSSIVDRCRDVVAAADASLTVAGDLTFLADPTRLQQLLENLLRNALDHGAPGTAIRVGALPDGDGFYVADDGPGIPADERESVFEAGYSTADSGTGFGLSIVAEIADAHGWEVDVTESDSGGARFEVTGVERVE